MTSSQPTIINVGLEDLSHARWIIHSSRVS